MASQTLVRLVVHSGGDGRFVQAGVLAVAARNGKTAWLAQMAKMQQAGPRTLAQTDWQHPESLDGQPLQGKAEWVSPYVWLLDNQIVNGEVGCDVLIPVRAEGGSSLLLVNLGWVPAPSDRSQLPNPAIPAAMTLKVFCAWLPAASCWDRT